MIFFISSSLLSLINTFLRFFISFFFLSSHRRYLLLCCLEFFSKQENKNTTTYISFVANADKLFSLDSFCHINHFHCQVGFLSFTRFFSLWIPQLCQFQSAQLNFYFFFGLKYESTFFLSLLSSWVALNEVKSFHIAMTIFCLNQQSHI